jgi:hypothetical protein
MDFAGPMSAPGSRLSPAVEAVLRLGFLAEARNVVLVAAHDRAT